MSAITQASYFEDYLQDTKNTYNEPTDISSNIVTLTPRPHRMVARVGVPDRKSLFLRWRWRPPSSQHYIGLSEIPGRYRGSTYIINITGYPAPTYDILIPVPLSVPKN